MRCKVKLTEISRNTSGYKLVYEPVTSGSEENAKFFKYTPYGRIELGTINVNVVEGLEPGKEYFLDFTEAS